MVSRHRLQTETPILWFHCDMFLFLLQSYRFLDTAGQWLDWVVRHSIVEILPIRFPRQSAYWSKLSTNYVTNDQPTSQGKPPRHAFALIVWTCKQVKMILFPPVVPGLLLFLQIHIWSQTECLQSCDPDLEDWTHSSEKRAAREHWNLITSGR